MRTLNVTQNQVLGAVGRAYFAFLVSSPPALTRSEFQERGSTHQHILTARLTCPLGLTAFTPLESTPLD